MMRFAGDLIQYILKNPFTEGFQRGMDHVVIAPIERAVASDADLIAKIPAMIGADATSNALPTLRQIEALSALKGAPVDVQALVGKVNSLIDEGMTPNDAYSSLALGMMDANNSPREAMQRAAGHVVQGDRGLTEVGDSVRSFLLGSPAAAYGTAAVGAGLVGYGGYNAYQQLQQSMQEQAMANEAAQREEEKKKQAAARASAAAGQGQG
jgi:hypothetical protein